MQISSFKINEVFFYKMLSLAKSFFFLCLEFHKDQAPIILKSSFGLPDITMQVSFDRLFIAL